MKYVLIVVLSFTVTYAVGVFVSLEPNLMEWDAGARMLMAFVVVFAAFIVFIDEIGGF